MNKFEALEEIKSLWNDNSKSLYDKIINISSLFYSTGLDVPTTAAYIRATQIELDSLLALSEFDDEIIQLIAKINPPKTTWGMLSEASEEEIKRALNALENSEKLLANYKDKKGTISEYVYKEMIKGSAPSNAEKLNSLSAKDIKHLRNKGEDYGCLNKFQINFLKGVASQKGKNIQLSIRQIDTLKKAIEALIEHDAITRNSIDNDQEFCDRVLDAMGK